MVSMALQSGVSSLWRERGGEREKESSVGSAAEEEGKVDQGRGGEAVGGPGERETWSTHVVNVLAVFYSAFLSHWFFHVISRHLQKVT